MNDFIQNILNSSAFFSEDTSTPIQAKYTPGNSHLLIVTGENATGKSFLRRVFSSMRIS